jgi:hypothetical protein
MKLGYVVAAALLMSGCAWKLDENGVAPSPVPQPQAGVPARIELAANPGTGAEAGTGTITARVFDGLSTALRDQTVTFTATGLALAASQVVTDETGFARTSITGPEGSFQIVAAIGTIETRTLIAIQSQPPTPMQPVPPSFPPATPTQPPTTTTVPAPSYTVTLTAAPPSVVVNGSSTLTAAVTQNNGASAPTGYAWDCNADGTFDPPIADNFKACTYGTAGTIKSAVRVTSASLSGSATVEVVVEPAAPLLVAITALPTGTIGAGITIVYTASLSSIGGPSAVPAIGINWEWDLDGDNTYDFASSSHTNTDSKSENYSAPKEFTVRARATDTATGRTAVGTRAVKVQ